MFLQVQLPKAHLFHNANYNMNATYQIEPNNFMKLIVVRTILDVQTFLPSKNRI